MDFLFGSSNQSQPTIPDTALRIQTAVAGRPRPIGCGNVRLAPNLIWANDFQAIAQQVGGKGALFGGGKGGGTTFTYQVAIIMALCEGPILGYDKVWNQQNVVVHQVGASVFLGSYTQTAWSYVTSNHPDQALAYRGLAYVGYGPMFLGNSSAIPNITFEIEFPINNGIPGYPDADPRDWIVNLLTNSHWGAGFPTANLDTLDLYSNWCRGTGMVVSDALVAQQSLSDYLGTLMEATDAEFVWSNGTLTIVPYGDVTVVGNGASYVPPAAPVATLGDDDFIDITGGSAGSGSLNSKARVQIKRPRFTDFDNWVQVEYQNRAGDYNKAVVEAKDDAAIIDVGFQFNQAGVRRYDFFAIQQAALMSAHLVLGRQLVRNQYTFALDRRWLKLDPMDIVAINDPIIGLVNKWVRIREITEEQDGSLTVQGEEYLQGTATPYNYNAAGVCCLPDLLGSIASDPGPTSFVYWDATYAGVPDGPAIVVAAGGAGVPTSPRVGNKGMVTLWYYPKYFHDNATTSGSQTIFQSLPNDGGLTGFKVEGVFHGAGANVQIGLNITAQVAGGGTVTLTEYADGGAQASIPTTGYAVIVTWDFTTDNWMLSARLGTASGLGTVATSTTVEADAMDSDHPLFQNVAITAGVLGAYTVGDGTATSIMDIAQLWIALDDDVDGLDLSIPSTLWTKFFCDTTTHAEAPVDLLTDGSGPGGCPPTFYFNNAVGTGGNGAGLSTGCLAGSVMPTKTGTISGISTGTIPPCHSYQARGFGFGASTKLTGPEPFGGITNNWGSCQVWISTDGGTHYTNQGFMPGPSPIGLLTANFASGSDPDTTHTLSVNLTETQQALSSFPTSDADAGRSRSIIGTEIIDFSTATLTSPFNYDMGTYIRRGQLGTTIASHSTGDTFGVLGVNAITIKYPVSLIGTTIHVKFVAQNKTGGGSQNLADVPDHTITLVGPGAPAAPATLTAIEPVASSGAVVLSWPASATTGVTSYDLAYNTGGPDTVVPQGLVLSATLAGLTAGAYTFKVRAVNPSGDSTYTTTTLTVT